LPGAVKDYQDEKDAENQDARRVTQNINGKVTAITENIDHVDLGGRKTPSQLISSRALSL
jgi:hypothetical protein